MTAGGSSVSTVLGSVWQQGGSSGVAHTVAAVLVAVFPAAALAFG